MKKHFFLKTMLVAALGVTPVLAQADIGIGQCKQQVQKTAMQQNTNAMTQAEQQFAMKLSALHRQIFMTVFTPDLRKEAMAAMTSPDNEDDESPITEDMAVEQVITNHRDMATMQPGSSNQKYTNQPQTQKQPAKQTKNSSNSNKKKSYWD